MEIIKEYDPVTLAEYARDYELLHQQEWNWARKCIVLRTKSLNHLRRIYAKKKKHGPKYQFGELVPTSIKDAYTINKKNKSSRWKEANDKEITQLTDEYYCFKMLKRGEKPPPDYIFIPLLWTFAV